MLKNVHSSFPSLFHFLNSTRTNIPDNTADKKSDTGKVQYTPYMGRKPILSKRDGKSKRHGIKNKICLERLKMVLWTGLPIAWKNCPPIICIAITGNVHVQILIVNIPSSRREPVSLLNKEKQKPGANCVTRKPAEKTQVQAIYEYLKHFFTRENFWAP